MADSDMTEKPGLRVRYRDLAPRAIVGVLLIAVALFGSWRGGLFFNYLIGLAALLMFREWARMHGMPSGEGSSRFVGFTGIGAAVVLANEGLMTLGVAALAATTIYYLFTRRAAALGVLYCGLPALALVWLRDQESGFPLLVWTLVVVWATDIGAYFAGRLIGGPKLAPRISPSKTWAGLFGAMVAAGALGAAMTAVFRLPFELWQSAVLGAALAIAAQAGDFYESHLKRRAGIKDSGNLLPGHGGIMDRLDGLVPVSIIVAGTVWALGA